VTVLLISILTGCLLVQGLFWLAARKLGLSPEMGIGKSDDLPAISVLIAARNEAQHLAVFLPKVLAQDYPSFEVVVANDASTDGSALLLDSLEKDYGHLRVLNFPHKKGEGKKIVLQEALRMARNEWIVLTDADCRPCSNRWLRGLAQHFKPGTDLVMGYGPYAYGQGWIKDFIRFEAFMTAVLYGTFQRFGMPYMAVGRNLAIRRDCLAVAQESEAYGSSPFGDDDLAVQAIARADNTALQFHPEAWVESVSKESFSAYIMQKRRHLSVSRFYKVGHQVVLAILGAAQALFYPVLVGLLPGNILTCAFFFVLRTLIFAPACLARMQQLGLGDLKQKVFFLDFQFSLYYWWISLRLLSLKKLSWR